MKIIQNIQRGFSLITAIFLLVVIAALATFSITLFTTQQRGAALDVQGERAYQAARAGLEWGAFQVLSPANACPAATQTLAPLPNTLAVFGVQVVCIITPVSEAGAAVTMHQITSTATLGNQGTPNYLERQVQVTIAN